MNLNKNIEILCFQSNSSWNFPCFQSNSSPQTARNFLFFSDFDKFHSFYFNKNCEIDGFIIIKWRYSDPSQSIIWISSKTLNFPCFQSNSSPQTASNFLFFSDFDKFHSFYFIKNCEIDWFIIIKWRYSDPSQSIIWISSKTLNFPCFNPEINHNYTEF